MSDNLVLNFLVDETEKTIKTSNLFCFTSLRMSKKKYENLLEYEEFLEYFNSKLFTIYQFNIKPTYSHITELLTLENHYYNSFYAVSLVKCYFAENKDIDDVEVIKKISEHVFWRSNAHARSERLNTPLKQTRVNEIDAAIEECKIEKLEMFLNDYNFDDFDTIISYITKRTLIRECLELNYRSIFLEAFVASIDEIILFDDLIQYLLLYLTNIDISTFLDEKLGEEDLNYSIDYLEISLYTLNTYLEAKNTTTEKITKTKDLTTKTILEQQVKLLHDVQMEDLNKISIEYSDFIFSKKFFEEMSSLLTTSQVLETDLFVIFKLTFSIFVLSMAHENKSIVNQMIGKTMLNKEFMIREDLMVDLQLQIIKCIFILKDVELAKQHLKLLLNSNAIVFLTKSNREKVISYLKLHEVLNSKERMDIVRRSYFNIKVSLDESKNQLRENEATFGLLCVFLEYISHSDSSSHFIEINNYFTSFSSYEQSIEYYADFLSRNNFEAPLWTFLRSSETVYIIRFYLYFFRKVKRNSEQRRLRHKNDSLDYSLIIDKHVTNFCKIFLERKDINLVIVLNAIPYLPEKPEYYTIYLHLWRFIFDQNAENEMLFFKYKTPPLTNLSLDSDINAQINSNLLEKVYMLLAVEKNHELFSRSNIQKHYTHFICILILFTEREKIRNFMFDGIYKYLKDAKLLKNGFQALMYTMIGIHHSFIIKYDKLKLYLLNLLYIFCDSYDSTKKIIYEIMKLIIKNEKYLIFDLEINIQYNKCIDHLKSIKRSKSTQVLLVDLINTYRTDFLFKIKNKATVLHSYLILTFCNVDFFTELGINFSGNFFEYNSYIKTEMNKIKRFSANIKPEIVFDDSEKYMWLVDAVYMNKYNAVLVRRCINLLRSELKKNYSLNHLYILIKIYNIMSIREEETEFYLKKAIYMPLDFNNPYDSVINLQRETTDFYNYYFSQLIFLYSDYSQKTKPIIFPTNRENYEGFTLEDIIFIYNTFKKTILFEYLVNNNVRYYLNYFYNIDSLSLPDIVSILKNSEEKEMIKKALEALRTCDILYHIPQLVQCLNRKQVFSEVFLALHDLCKDEHVCHFLLWNLKSNVVTGNDVYANCIKDLESTYAHRKIETPVNDTNETPHKFLQEIYFFDELTRVSSSMMPYLKLSKSEKTEKLNAFINKIEVPPGIYLPTDVDYEILGIVQNSGRVLQSHAKVPFMASFYCVKRFDFTADTRQQLINNYIENTTLKTENPVIIKNLIFKSGDDCRQDMLAIQLISMFKNIFETNNLDLYLFPYQVISTGPDTGIIEVIPNAITRDQMGREKINNLVDYFEYRFGFRESETYVKAVYNFTRSFAAYSLVTYFLNIRDRHNGNIMIDGDGHIVHIDFGYMLEISPGNINLEIPIKLTHEIHDLLLSSEMYDLYVDLVFKGFFVLRRNSKDIIFMLDSFKGSGLPCFRKKALQNFIDRFKFNLSDDEAKVYIITLVNSSIKKMRTWVYDKYQEITNNIAF